MERDIEKDLLYWKNQLNRMPLLLRGARQVGKTFIVEKFGKQHFDNVVAINFEWQKEYLVSFENLDPVSIINNIQLLSGQSIIPGKTLLFLDEIQDCPNAILSLRYFKEKLPTLHVIGAGSLLDFTLNDAKFRMPVGRVQFLFLKPLSFKEYLTALGLKDLRTFIESINLSEPVPENLHQRLLILAREYMILGGMPAVLQNWSTSKNIKEVQLIQTSLLNTYRLDFGKYASKTEHKYLQSIFDKMPNLIVENFKYVNVNSDMRSRDIKHALEVLQYAGLINIVYHTSASGIPLTAQLNEKKFKLLFLDVGLITRASRLESELLLNNDLLLINRGILAEQFVGQELLATSSRFEEGALYYWRREERSSNAEIDFVKTVGANIVPIEVKAGTTGRLKSLKLFLEEKHPIVGVRISQLPLSYHDNILSVPIYMVGEIDRLVEKLI